MEQQQKPFHSSEVSLLVLRYLAGIKCTDTAKCFFKELPGLKEFLQSKNRGCETPRAFEGPEVLGSLEDILYDYGKAKMMVKKLVVRLMNEWRVLSEDDVSPCDTLGTQLRQVSTLLSTTFSQPRSSGCGSPFLAIAPPKSTRNVETQTSDLIAVIRTKRVASTCTTLDIPEGQNIVVTNVKIMQEEEVQTNVTIPKDMDDQHGIGVEEFIKTVTYPDVPIEMAFRENLLRNTDFQQTIANSINDARGIGVEEFIKTVSGKAENEIDNFLADLLQAEEKTHGGYSWSSMSVDFGGNGNEISDIPVVNLDDNDAFQVQNNVSQSQLNTPGKVMGEPSVTNGSPVASTSAGLAEEVRLNLKSNPVQQHYKSPRNSRKAKAHQVIPRNSQGTTVTLSPGRISAWQMLGRRNIVPKIPVTTSAPKATPPQPPPEPQPPPLPVSSGVAIQNDIFGCVEEVVRGTELCPDSPQRSSDGMILNQGQGQVVTMPKPQPQPLELQKADVRIESIKKSENKMEVQVSPMLQKLMASAQKFRQASSTGLTKSSFSTPRKKSHVRNLMFTTPPSCSAISKTANISIEEMSIKDQNLTRSVPVGRKRKADQISTDPQRKSPNNPVPKSRKRLDWADEQTNRIEQGGIRNPVVLPENEAKKPSPPIQKSHSSRRTNKNTTSMNNGYSATIENVVQYSQKVTFEDNLRNDTIENVHRVETKPPKTSKSAKSTKFSKTSEHSKQPEPLSTSEPPTGTKPPKTSESTKTPKPPTGSESTKTPKPPKGSESTKAPKPPKGPESTKTSKSSRTSDELFTTSQPLKLSERPRTSEPPKNSERSKHSEHHKISKHSKTSKPPRLSEPLKASEPPKKLEPTKTTEPPKKSDFPTTAEPSKKSEPPKKSELLKKVEPLKVSKPSKAADLQKVSKPPKSFESSKGSRPHRNSEPKKKLKPPQQISPSEARPLPPLPLQSPFVPPLPPFPQRSPSLPPPPPPTSPPQSSPSLPPPPPPPAPRQRSPSLPPPPPPPPPPPLVSPPPLPSDETASPLPPIPESSPLQQTSFSQSSLAPSLAYSSQSQIALPAVTPVKIIAPAEQSMEFPPTPSTDRYLNNFGNSWDSSDGKITLHYENNGIYPTNLLLSTPFKDGLPRTPGRFSPTPDGKSLSSCSSIFETPDVVAYKDRYQPYDDELNTPIPKMSTYVPPTPQILGKSSGGNIHTRTDLQEESCKVTSTSQEIPKQSESGPSSLNGNEKSASQCQREGINFEVSGRAKKLTLSEQQTLFCLLEMRKGVGSPSAKIPPNGSDPTTGSSYKVDKDMMSKLNSLKNVNLDHFLTIVHGDRK